MDSLSLTKLDRTDKKSFCDRRTIDPRSTVIHHSIISRVFLPEEKYDTNDDFCSRHTGIVVHVSLLHSLDPIHNYISFTRDEAYVEGATEILHIFLSFNVKHRYFFNHSTLNRS